VNGFKADKQKSSPKAFGLDSPNHPISNLRSGRGVDVHLSFLRLSRSGWRWVYYRGVTLLAREDRQPQLHLQRLGQLQRRRRKERVEHRVKN